jgi:flagellar protein FliS
MYNKLPHQNYTQVQVSTVDRGRLLLMLFDGCLKFLRLCKDGLEKKDISKFAKYLSKSQAIISELMVTLDFEKGGQIAKDLDRLYEFMLFYLTEANIEKNPKKIQKVIELMETITAAYRDVIEKKPSEVARANEKTAHDSEGESAVVRSSFSATF